MRKGFYLIVILLFPSIIYLLFSLGEHHVKRLAKFGAFRLSEQGDTIYQPVPDIKLESLDGKSIQLSDYRGKPMLIDLFEMPCDDACVKKKVTLVNYLRKLQERDKWAVASIASDTSVSLEEITTLKNKLMPEMKNWAFLKPSTSEQLHTLKMYLSEYDTDSLRLEDQLVLIDQDGVIREFFDTKVYKENRKMEDAIKLLLQEPHVQWKDQKK